MKLLQCPACRQVGTLILNGFLTGYTESGCSSREIRGRRILCNSRRKRSPGCGRSFSVLRMDRVPHLAYTTSTLQIFLEALTAGAPVIRAFLGTGLTRSIRTIYRLYKRIRNRQATIRTSLLRICPAPIAIQFTSTVAQTIAHLRNAFPASSQFLAKFQQTTQISVL